jgi:hypothetical protein
MFSCDFQNHGREVLLFETNAFRNLQLPQILATNSPMTLHTLWQNTYWNPVMAMCISNALKEVLRGTRAFILTALCYKRDVNIMQKVPAFQVSASVPYDECLNLVLQRGI